LRFDIKASSLPEYYKERLLAASHHLISADGVVIIKAQEYRSQEMNREAAIARLVALIQELTAVQKSPGDATDQSVKRAPACLKGAKILSQGAAWESSSVKAWRTGGMDNKEFTVKKIVFSVVAACSLFAYSAVTIARRWTRYNRRRWKS
jgi:hypothetical protein